MTQPTAAGPADTRTWWRCPDPRPAARVRLLCFPYGGGPATAYRAWHTLLPPEVELCTAQYPGHADRMTEPLADDLEQLAVVAARAALPLLDRPFAVYGHSMGALVAFEAALCWERLGHRPLRLTASGMPAPHLVRATGFHRGGDAALLAELRRLGGIPQPVLDDDSLRALLLRVARADYRLVETYRPRAGASLRAPVTVHRARDDPELTAAEATGWALITTGPTVHRAFSGDHFHPVSDPAPVVAELLSALGTVVSPASGR
ncbi:thioesterase II family protein [Micromonospora sp. NPDC018662]|uniref:thioesterase II family protein n=1 Tax=Micromonospora sp. NPDC018662 TaxID=3364238 RepID=UPI0037B6D0C6